MKAPNHGCLVRVEFRDVAGEVQDVQTGHLMLATSEPGFAWQFEPGINLRVAGEREPLIVLPGDTLEVL